jgi:hypothetical protein
VRWLVNEVGVSVGDARNMFRSARRLAHPSPHDDDGRRDVCRVLAAKFNSTERDFPENGWTPEQFAAEFGPVAPTDTLRALQTETPTAAPTAAPNGHSPCVAD